MNPHVGYVETSEAVIIDSVLDFDPVKAAITFTNADEIASFVDKYNLKIKYILETHAHAVVVRPYIGTMPHLFYTGSFICRTISQKEAWGTGSVYVMLVTHGTHHTTAPGLYRKRDHASTGNIFKDFRLCQISL